MERPHRSLWHAALLVGFLVFPSGLSADASHAQAPYVLPETVKSWLEHGQAVSFLDVREADEFHAGHIPGARNIPHDQVPGLSGELPHNQPIVVYCIHSAHRAPEAAKALRAQGFDNAYVMEGGIVAWDAGGQPIRASDLTRQPKILPLTNRCADKEKPPS